MKLSFKLYLWVVYSLMTLFQKSILCPFHLLALENTCFFLKKKKINVTNDDQFPKRDQKSKYIPE